MCTPYSVPSVCIQCQTVLLVCDSDKKYRFGVSSVNAKQDFDSMLLSPLKATQEIDILTKQVLLDLVLLVDVMYAWLCTL